VATREIVKAFKELYGANALPSLIPRVTDAVLEQVIEWQSQGLDTVYPSSTLIVSYLKFAKISRLLVNQFT